MSERWPHRLGSSFGPGDYGFAMAWTCPDCKRSFGAKGRNHMCQPGLTLEEHFAAARPEAAPIFEVINAHLETLDGDLIVDPLSKKILFKNGPTIAILESMTKWVALGFTLRRRVVSTRFSRKVIDYQGKFYHVVNLTSAAQVDDELLEWLSEAFHKGDGPSVGADPMVPDDIDDEFLGSFDESP